MITIEEFRIFFKRDFPFCPIPEDPNGIIDEDECISDTDIARAIMEASAFDISDCLKDSERKIAWYYLVAHLLVMNIMNSNSGLASTYTFGENSKSVGSVSVGHAAIPENVASNPKYSWYFKTGYGARYFTMSQSCVFNHRFFFVKGATYNGR